MTTPTPEQCGASARIQIGPMPYIGPCVLRAHHDGPVHQDADGAQWTDPRPATAEDSAALCPPKQPDPHPYVHPYVHLTYGPWEPSGHQCADVQAGGCDDVPPERKVFARWNGIGEERFVGWELGDCPSCGPAGSLRDQLRRALHAYDTDIDARAVDNLVPVVEAWAAQNFTAPASSASTGSPETAPGHEVLSGLPDQIAEALTTERWGSEHDLGEHGKGHSFYAPCGICQGDVAAIVRLVMPVVEAETAARRASLDVANGNLRGLLAEQRQRADRAERERAEAFEALAYGAETLRHAEPVIDWRPAYDRLAHALTDARTRAETAERERDQALDLLRGLTDTRPCDPHPGTGYCQTHGEKPPCPHAAAKELLDALTIKQPREAR